MNQMWNRLQLLFGVGKALLVGRDTVQVSLLDEEILANIARVEPFGFSSHPLEGGQAYIVFPSGDRSYGVCLLVGDKRYQLDLLPGESALHDHLGNFVKIKQGGIVEVSASTKVVITSPSTEMSGDLHVMGQVFNGSTHIDASHRHTSTAPGNATSGVI